MELATALARRGALCRGAARLVCLFRRGDERKPRAQTPSPGATMTEGPPGLQPEADRRLRRRRRPLRFPALPMADQGTWTAGSRGWPVNIRLATGAPEGAPASTASSSSGRACRTPYVNRASPRPGRQVLDRHRHAEETSGRRRRRGGGRPRLQTRRGGPRHRCAKVMGV